ncbi:MAG: hypothetical protein CMA13_02850 [Euryarchaeota archaeon]|nr:hypothetical protein [Euryarchaeota archaeon]
MNMMQHLQVPNRDVKNAFTSLKKNNLLAEGKLIYPSIDGKFRLIPLSENLPKNLPKELSKYEVIYAKYKLDNRIDPNWLTHLSVLINNDDFEKFLQLWPASHEFVGDMMIIKLDKKILQFSSQIAKAKLMAHPNLRLILSDQGVMGELRIRELIPIAVRHKNIIISENIPNELCNTKVTVKESGLQIICDPTKAYFSTKLQTERQETLSFAKELRHMLGRKINLCDPFCGVGPAISSLLHEPDLVNNLLSSDLNPEAIKLLFENLTKWDKKPYPSEASEVEWIYPNRLAGAGDVAELVTNREYLGRWDMILINLPHRTLELLPLIIPLLDTSSPSLIRGRIVVEEKDIDITNKIIQDILPNCIPDKPKPKLTIKRDYSSKLRLCSFEAWLK